MGKHTSITECTEFPHIPCPFPSPPYTQVSKTDRQANKNIKSMLKTTPKKAKQRR